MAFTQTTIKGIVKTTKGETVIGANVVLEGTYDGASTDTLGIFKFTTTEKGEKHLIITFIGCDTLKMPIILRGGETLDFNLKIKEIANELNEVTISAGVFEASDVKKAVVLKSVDIAMTAVPRCCFQKLDAFCRRCVLLESRQSASKF